MMITKQANGRFLWTNHIWDRELCNHVAQLAVDLDDVIYRMREQELGWSSKTVEELGKASITMARLTRIREGLNKVMEIIELENTTPRFSTKSIKAIDLIWAS